MFSFVKIQPERAVVKRQCQFFLLLSLSNIQVYINNSTFNCKNHKDRFRMVFQHETAKIFFPPMSPFATLIRLTVESIRKITEMYNLIKIMS